MTRGEFYADAIRGIVTETERNTLDRVLEIIDRCEAGSPIEWAQGYNEARYDIRKAVLALKEGEQE